MGIQEWAQETWNSAVETTKEVIDYLSGNGKSVQDDISKDLNDHVDGGNDNGGNDGGGGEHESPGDD